MGDAERCLDKALAQPSIAEPSHASPSKALARLSFAQQCPDRLSVAVAML